MSARHEGCRCGHCCCQHDGGYGSCLARDCQCFRYRWPGEGAGLPADHERALEVDRLGPTEKELQQERRRGRQKGGR